MKATPFRELSIDPLAALSDAEAEQGLLGSLLLDNRAYEHVVDLVRPQDFSYPVHGNLFAAIGTLVAEAIIANPVTLAYYVEGDSSIEKGYIDGLVDGAVTVVNAPHYARLIAGLARRRAIVAAAQETIADASVVDPERGDDLVLDDAEERLFEIKGMREEAHAGPLPIGEVARQTIRNIEAAYKAGGIVSIDTGIADLDRIVAGMSAGDLDVLAGRPGMGKSAAVGTIAVNQARAGRHIAIFSMEMTGDELLQRWLAGDTGISTERQRHGRIDPVEWPGLIEAGERINSLGIVVDAQPRLSVAQIRQRSRRIRRRHGLDLIIIDHLQLIRQGGRQESRRLEIGDATSALKAVAKELQVPVLLLSQLNRSVESRDNKRPVLSDLKESGSIEEDADVVMFLYREEYYLQRSEPRRTPGQTDEAYNAAVSDWQMRCADAAGLAEIEVAKNRHGKTGRVRLRFDGERQRFYDLERGR